MAPRLDARVNAVNEDLVGLGFHCCLLAPMGVWKLWLTSDDLLSHRSWVLWITSWLAAIDVD